MAEPMEDDNNILPEYSRRRYLIDKRLSLLTRQKNELEMMLNALRELINDSYIELHEVDSKLNELRKKQQ